MDPLSCVTPGCEQECLGCRHTACAGIGCGIDGPGSALLAVAVTPVRPRPGGRRLPRRVGTALIAGYRRLVSSRTAPRCRFRPSCSRYGYAAVDRYGLWSGGRLALARILRCTSRVPPGTVDELT